MDWIGCTLRNEFVTSWRVELVYQPGALVRLKAEGWYGFQLERGTFECPEDKTSPEAVRGLLARGWACGSATMANPTVWSDRREPRPQGGGLHNRRRTVCGTEVYPPLPCGRGSRAKRTLPTGSCMPEAVECEVVGTVRCSVLCYRALVLAAATALAAPVPPPGERDKIAAVWGKPFARSEKYASNSTAGSSRSAPRGKRSCGRSSVGRRRSTAPGPEGGLRGRVPAGAGRVDRQRRRVGGQPPSSSAPRAQPRPNAERDPNPGAVRLRLE